LEYENDCGRDIDVVVVVVVDADLIINPEKLGLLLAW